MFNVVFSDTYERAEKRFLKQHPDLKKRYRKTLDFLEKNPFHPSLRLHPLHGKLSGLHSASISMQYRITLELEVHEQEIILVNAGSHRRGVLMNRFASASVKPQPDARTNPLTLEPLPW